VGPVLRTERLELRPFAEEDATSLHSLFTATDVRRYLLDGLIVPRDWVEEEVGASAARFRNGGAGLWALRALDSPDVIIGFVGFRPFFDPPELQLLYGLDPMHWGQGLATEAARAAIDFALGDLGLSEVRAATDAPNDRSIAVLRRLGMSEWKRTDDGEHGTIFFRIGSTD
jgi:ribosomal-protein-alanine N-acetyltransferase